MGLAISVGALSDMIETNEESVEWIREQFGRVNEMLQANGLPPHHEPEHVADIKSRAPCDSFPYSFLHYLRRAAAKRRLNRNWVAERDPSKGDPTKEAAVTQLSDNPSYHLLVHSDAEGFYVPVQFQKVLVDQNALLVGAMLGSSYRLRDELIEVAPALGIHLDVDGELSDAEASRIGELSDDEGSPIYRELLTWLVLYEAARLSIDHRTAISFS